MKIEENIYAVMFLKIMKKWIFWKNSNFSKFWRAPKRAQKYDVLKIKKIIGYRADLHFESLWLDKNWRK